MHEITNYIPRGVLLAGSFIFSILTFGATWFLIAANYGTWGFLLGWIPAAIASLIMGAMWVVLIPLAVIAFIVLMLLS